MTVNVELEQTHAIRIAEDALGIGGVESNDCRLHACGGARLDLGEELLNESYGRTELITLHNIYRFIACKLLSVWLLLSQRALALTPNTF